MEKFGIYCGVQDEVKELSNGDVVLAHNNGTFTVFGKKRYHSVFRNFRPSWRYKNTTDGVKKINEPYQKGDEALLLDMYNGTRIHNGFGLTNIGIFSFITGEIVELPEGAKKYSLEIEGTEIVFIIAGKRYSFNGTNFSEL